MQIREITLDILFVRPVTEVIKNLLLNVKVFADFTFSALIQIFQTESDVTVSARSLKDQAAIRSCGMKAISSEQLTGHYDLIFNTVPSLILHAQALAKIAADALVIDLASAPGGVDFEAAERLSIPTVHALSLPGKVAPKTSGIIIKNAVYNIIREEGL